VRIHLVDQVILHAADRRGIERPLQDDHSRRSDARPVFSGQNLDALRRRIGALVELTGQILHRKGRFVVAQYQFLGSHIHLWFRKNQPCGGGEFGVAEAIDIVAIDHPDAAQAVQPQRLVEIMKQVTGLGVEAGQFFDEDSMHGRGQSGALGSVGC
jgi:hypothetical protein